MHVFLMQEPGDLNLGAVAMLACVSSLLETLVGEGGLWLESIPDLDLLHHMRVSADAG